MVRRSLALTFLVALVGCDRSPHEGTAHAATVEASAAASVTPSADEPARAEATAPAEIPSTPSGPKVWPPGRDDQPTLDGDHIYAKSRHLWIRPQPRDSGSWLGYLSLGDAIRVKGGNAEKARVDAPGTGRWCTTWYAVEPVGYVCVGELATLDGDDPDIVELRRRAADPSSPFPYRYGESLDAAVYVEPPPPEIQRRREYALEQHLEKLALIRKAKDEAAVAAIDERLVGVDLSPAGKGPPRLLPNLPPHGRPNQQRIHNGSTLAYVDSFDHAGRSFLLTWDGGIVPKDKVKPYPESTFHGVILGAEASLPLAFIRVKDRPRYERKADGSFAVTKKVFPRLSWVALSDERASQGDEAFLATKDGEWIAERDAAVARAAEAMPRAVVRDGDDDGTWLDISILGGTLVAYEGMKPVYATMISPGRGGIPQTGVPTLETASTPTGTYSVLGKFLTATMQSSSIATLVHAEVQYTMNFSGPYAVHGAYWHDQWGEPKSGGCVNLAPIDAQRIFRWAKPRLPPGWHGMRTLPKSHDFGRPTFVHLRR